MHILRYPLTSLIDKYNEFSEIKVIQMLQRILKMLLVNILSYRKVIDDPDSMYFPQKMISSNNTRGKKKKLSLTHLPVISIRFSNQIKSIRFFTKLSGPIVHTLINGIIQYSQRKLAYNQFFLAFPNTRS